MEDKPLTAKQQRFCEEYVVDFNATQASIRAGYAAKSVNAFRVIGCHNLMKVNVNAEVSRLKANLAKKTAYTQETGLVLLLEAYAEAKKLKQPAAMVSAVVGANRMHGFDKDANIGEKTIIIISPKVVESRPVEPQAAIEGDKQDEEP